MAHVPTSPAGFPGWSALAPVERLVWGYLMMPGKRKLAAFAKAEGWKRQTAHTAKRRGEDKLRAACLAHGGSFDSMLDAYRRGQDLMVDAPR